MSLETELDIVAIASLSVTALFAIASIITGFALGSSLSKTERWVLAWLIYDVLVHFLLEGPFLFLSLTGTVNKSDHFMALLWKEYGKADSRWLHSDPTIVSLEILTVVLVGCLCLVTIYSIITQAYYRHFFQLVVCVCELYGGWMTFCPEWLTGSPNLNTSNILFLWVYLVFFNGLWVVIPAALMVQSWVSMKEAFQMSDSKRKKCIGKGGKEAGKNQAAINASKSRKDK